MRKSASREPAANLSRSSREPDREPEPERWNLLDHPSWAWVAAARLRQPPVDEPEPWTELVPFSTFAVGQEPDVWPVLEKKTAASFWDGAAVGAILVCLLWLGCYWRGWIRPLLAAGVRR